MIIDLAKNGKTIAISAVVFVALLVLGNIGIRKIFVRHREIKKIDAKIKIEASNNERLKKEINLAKTDLSYIERLARKELGLIQPGEIEYRFLDKTGDGNRTTKK